MRTRRTVLGLLAATALLALSVGKAGADILCLDGWLVYGGTAHVQVYDGHSTHDNTYNIGSFRGLLNGHRLAGPIYCLDIFHSFNFGQTWNVLPTVVPPDPPNPPPWNTGEAVWLFNKYQSVKEPWQVGGLQLALWETSHQLNWREKYHQTDRSYWADHGDFEYQGSMTGNTMGRFASDILADLYANYDPARAGHCTYFEPLPTRNEHYGQGQLTTVPEPGTVVLFGTSLLALAGAAWRRRQRS